MNIKLLILTALRVLMRHKFRSFLTILSIIVGISALISTLAIGYGAEAKIRSKIQSMGKNYIFVHAGNHHQQGKTKATKLKNRLPLSLTDSRIIKQQIPQIKYLSPQLFAGQKLVTYQTNSILTDIDGVDEHVLAIIDRTMKCGTFVNSSHVEGKVPVAVLGSKAAQELFGLNNPLGKTITIEKHTFQVIGVIEEEKEFLGTHDPNIHIFIPVTTLRKTLRQKDDEAVDGISISTYDTQSMPEVVRRIKKALRFAHKLEPQDPDDFTIYDQQSMIKAAAESSNILNIFLLIIASISLLVGGIGVMNIMLVSVTERTREIGIRMALGATSSLILRQFIFEAITLCFVGGILGLLVGILIPFIASLFTGWIVIFKLHSILSALIITTLVGIFFGFYPAYKASHLNPVQALTER